jgi:hypothetical protein
LTDNKKVDNDATLTCNCDVENDPTNDDENSSTESVEANLQNIEDDSDASSSEVSWRPPSRKFWRGGVKKYLLFVQITRIFLLPFLKLKMILFLPKNKGGG